MFGRAKQPEYTIDCAPGNLKTRGGCTGRALGLLFAAEFRHHPGDVITVMCPSNPSPLSPLIPGRGGRPTYSLEALRERVERQFHAETDGRDDILRELRGPADQRALLGEIADYVLAVESVTLDTRSRAALIEAARASLFTFGPLDPLIADETVTEIVIDGPARVAVRRGLGRRQPDGARFDDAAHLAEVMERLLAAGDADTPAGSIITERGALLEGRRARISAVMPPLSAAISVQIRLHPLRPITLEALHAQYATLPAAAEALLGAIVRGGHGLLIAGEAGTGKTALAGALAARLPHDAGAIAVERAAELSLPDTIARETASPARSFADALRAALDRQPTWLLLDELRGDEIGVLWPALAAPSAPRVIGVWRGAPQPDRLRSALNIAIRREQPALPQEALDGILAASFPFIVALKAAGDGARLAYLAETRLEANALRLTPLIVEDGGAWRLSGERPIHPLDLPDELR